MNCRRVLPALLLATLSGCGQNTYAPVSGQVIWENKPLADAYVYFQPIGTESGQEPGLESYARTDKEGKFTLMVVVSQQPGAKVGKHRVRISRFDSDKPNTSDAGSPATNLLPPQFNTQTQLTFDVPAGGTDQAIFRLAAPLESP